MPFVIDLLKKYGFNSNIDIIENVNIEIHYAISNNSMVESQFGIHTDNDNGININTLICYLDIDCDGGDRY